MCDSLGVVKLCSDPPLVYLDRGEINHGPRCHNSPTDTDSPVRLGHPNLGPAALLQRAHSDNKSVPANPVWTGALIRDSVRVNII